MPDLADQFAAAQDHHTAGKKRKDKTALFSMNLMRSPVLCWAAQASHSTDLGQVLPCEYVYEQLSRSNQDSGKDSNVVGQQHIPCFTVKMHALCDLLPEKHMHRSSMHSRGVMKVSD